MADPALEAMLHGLYIKNKVTPAPLRTNSRFELESKKLVHTAVNLIIANEDDNRPKLISKEMRAIQLENEFNTALQYKDLRDYLTSAMNVIAKGKRYLGPTPYAMMIGEMIKSITHLDSIALENIYEENLQTILNLSEDTMDSLLTIAIAKYDENSYLDSLAVFTLLSTLVPENFNYWFRSGIAAQKSEKYELALNAYAIATCLASERLESRIFSCECYLLLGQRSDAEAEYEEARATLDALPMEERNKEQLELLSHLEVLIKNYSLTT